MAPDKHHLIGGEPGTRCVPGGTSTPPRGDGGGYTRSTP